MAAIDEDLEKFKVVKISMPAHMLDHLRECAKKEGVSVVEFMRRAVVVRMRDIESPP